MPHARQSSGDCQKKRLHSEIFENSEQYNTLCHMSRHAGTNVFQQEFPSMSTTRYKLISAVES